MSIANGFGAAAREAVLDYGANAMQIFTKNPRGRGFKPLQENDLREYREYKRRLKFVIAHSSYLLNFGKPLDEIPWAEKDLLTDFERIDALEGEGVVVHVGKALDGDTVAAFKNITENAKRIIQKTAGSRATYILENTAGQGSELGYKLEHLAKIKKSMEAEGGRFKFCFDTAHLWAAGYDLSSAGAAKKLLTEIDSAVGMKNVACLHFNDSKKDRGSRVDRHDNLGKGLIPLEGLGAVLNYAVSKSIPVILETPDKNPGDRLADIRVLKEMFQK